MGLIKSSHMISDKGISSTENRVKCLLNASEAQNASEVSNVLALVNFSARYISDLANINESLRKLTLYSMDTHFDTSTTNSF